MNWHQTMAGHECLQFIHPLDLWCTFTLGCAGQYAAGRRQEVESNMRLAPREFTGA